MRLTTEQRLSNQPGPIEQIVDPVRRLGLIHEPDLCQFARDIVACACACAFDADRIDARTDREQDDEPSPSHPKHREQARGEHGKDDDGRVVVDGAVERGRDEDRQDVGRFLPSVLLHEFGDRSTGGDAADGLQPADDGLGGALALERFTLLVLLRRGRLILEPDHAASIAPGVIIRARGQIHRQRMRTLVLGPFSAHDSSRGP